MSMITLEELEKYSSGEYEPWFENMWRVDKMPAIGKGSLPSPLVETVNLPLPTFGERTKQIASTTIYLASASDPGSFTLEVAQTARLHALRYFTDWQALVQNPYTGGYRMPSVYKKNISVTLYDTTGKPIVQATVRNCWPVSYEGLTLGRTQNNSPGQVQMRAEALIWKWMD